MIIDLSTSAVARGKIATAAKAGGTIPEGWAVNAQGQPITDAKEALMGMLAPLGGAKGFALGLMVELSRKVPDMFNPDDDTKPQSISHTVITIDPNDIGDSSSYEDFNALASSITETGGRIPGSKRVHPNNLGTGEITIAEPVLNDLNAWSAKLGLASI
jgi:(2R)-3-sulfolactate dehydrogenase (NADP+)